MMRALITASLRLPLPVVALSVILMAVGVRAANNAPFDVFPEFAPPLVEIQTEAPGLSSSDVEALISVPLEAALTGVPGLDVLRSKSVLGLSSVVLIFENGTERIPARQLVQERVARVASALPAAARPPVILSPLSSLSRVMKIGMSSSSLSQVDLTTLARGTVLPRLMAVPGGANVAIWGQRDRQLQVLVDPDRLRANGVTLQDVVTSTQDAMSVTAGGLLEGPNQRMAVTHTSPVKTATDLGQMAISSPATPPSSSGAVPTIRRLMDVADVVEGHPPPIGDGVVNGGPGLLLIVEKQPEGNTLQVTRDVEGALTALKPALAGVEVDSTIFRPATFIEMSLANLNRALLVGCVLVVFVLAMFLWDWRTAVISLTAIPLSLLAAALVLGQSGGTLNTMVIAGLIIALGEVVDDAIIDVENIVRRLRLNRAAAEPKSAFQVVLEASLEVRSAVVYGSVIVVLVFLPVFFLEGLAGSFFRPLALAYVLAIAASLLVALIVTPALSLMLLPQSTQEQEAPLVVSLKRRYRRMLPGLVSAPRRALGIIALSLITAAGAFPFRGEEFLPHFKESAFLMHWVEKPGTSLDAMRRITLRASDELRAIPGVRNFGAHLGRAEVADEVVGVNFTELWISLDPSVDYTGTVTRVQAVVDSYPGLQRDLLTYLRERIKEVLTGASATIVVRLFGPELDTLQRKAAEVGHAVAGVPGAADVKVQALTLVPQVEVAFDRDRGEPVGGTAGAVRGTVAAMLRGVKVGEVFDSQKVFDVVVWGAPPVRSDVFALRKMPVELPAGGYTPRPAVANVRIMPTPNEITREGGSRRIDITCNVRGRDLGAVARDIEAALGGLQFDAGYHPEVLGEYAARAESQQRLIALGVVSLLCILLVLHVDFGSVRMVALIALTIPFALIGGVAAVFLTGGVLSLGARGGFVPGLGLAASNGIMLISHYRHLEHEEHVLFGRELVMRGAEERLSPILMTALVTGLALLPIVLGGDRSGHEIEHPMAVVILGGL